MMDSAETHITKLLQHRGADSAGLRGAFRAMGLASFGICRKTRLNFYKRNPEVKRSGTAWVSDKSEAVVFKDAKCSLDFFGSFWVKPKTNKDQQLKQI